MHSPPQAITGVTPPEIAEAAVDELGNFMVHPDQADQVMQNLQALADKYWSTHK